MLKGSEESFGFWRPRRQQIVKRNAQLFLGVSTEVLLDEGRREAIEAGGHRRVGGEEVSRARGGQRHFKGLIAPGA